MKDDEVIDLILVRNFVVDGNIVVIRVDCIEKETKEEGLNYIKRLEENLESF